MVGGAVVVVELEVVEEVVELVVEEVVELVVEEVVELVVEEVVELVVEEVVELVVEEVVGGGVVGVGGVPGPTKRTVPVNTPPEKVPAN